MPLLPFYLQFHSERPLPLQFLLLIRGKELD